MDGLLTMICSYDSKGETEYRGIEYVSVPGVADSVEEALRHRGTVIPVTISPWLSTFSFWTLSRGRMKNCSAGTAW